MVTRYTTYEQHYTLSFVTSSDRQLQNSLYDNKSTINTKRKVFRDGYSDHQCRKRRKVGNHGESANDTNVYMVGGGIYLPWRMEGMEGVEVTLVVNAAKW